MQHRLGFGLAFIVGIGAAGAQEGLDGPRPDRQFRPIDVFALEYASDPRISPDGTTVAYVRRSGDIMTDRFDASIWAVSADGGTHRPLVQGEGAYGGPRWSPSGDRLLFTAREDGKTSLRVLYMDTLRTATIAELAGSPGSPSWSPDGSRIAFGMFVEGSGPSPAAMPARPDGAVWADAPIVIDDVYYRSDGGGYADPGHTQVFVLDAAGGTPRQMTFGEADHGGPYEWSRSGDRLLFSANLLDEPWTDPNESEIHSMDLASGEIETLTDRNGPDASPRLSPDGRTLAYLGYDDREQGYQISTIHLRDMRTGRVRTVADDLDRNIEQIEWDPSGRSIIARYDDHGVGRLAAIGLQGGRELLASGVGGTTVGRPYGGGSFTISEDSIIATVTTDSTRPGDVALRDRSTLTRLTDLNADLLDHKIVPPAEELLAASSHDGREIQAWVITPPDFDPDETYPMILEIHGGPFADYGPRFSAECQLMATAGYIVVYANPRGSTSYGEEFGNLIHHAYPSQDYDDLISVVDAAIDAYPIDEDRLFVTGGSGGGVLTAWIVGSTDRFAAAVVAKPVINWASFVLTADFYPFFTKYWFPAMPWEEPAHYWERSPLSLVGNVTTPTMLLTGEADYRTPISETEQYYQALQLLGVPTRMVRVPGASHGIASRPSRLVAKIANVLAWFEEHDPQR
ncbi:MAG: S9 family peptidase [Planctomycetota bacterium]